MNSDRLKRLREQYAAFYPVDPCAHRAFDRMEAALGVTFPPDAKAVGTFFSGDGIGGIEHYEFTDAETSFSIVEKTLELRGTISLPHAFVALAEPPESLILWNVESGEVVWCDSYDVELLIDGRKLQSTADRWSNYGEFFEYLLAREGEERDGE